MATIYDEAPAMEINGADPNVLILHVSTATTREHAC